MKRSERLKLLANIIKIAEEGEYGGKGEFVLPENHKAGMVVPKGGSCCANCTFFQERDNELHCTNKYWIQWNGGETKLPVDDATTYCSDWYMPEK